MRSIIKILLLLLPVFAKAQFDPNWGYISRQQADSFKNTLSIEKNDTLLMAAYRSLGFYYAETKLDSGLYFSKMQLEKAKKLNIKMWLADAYHQVGSATLYLGNISAANEAFVEAKKIAEDENNELSNWHYQVFSNANSLREARISIIALTYNDFGNLYSIIEESEQAKKSFMETIRLGEEVHNGKLISLAYGNLARLYSGDTVVLYSKRAIQHGEEAGYKKFSGNAFMHIAETFGKMKQIDSAFKYVHAAILVSLEQSNLRSLAIAYKAFAYVSCYQQHFDSSLLYAGKLINVAESLQSPETFDDAYSTLSFIYSTIKNNDSAYKYEQLSRKISDSLNDAKIKQLTRYQKLAFNEQLRLKKINDDKTAYQNNIKLYSVIGGLAALLIVAIVLYRNNREKQKTNKELETTLSNLKSTQSQLIQAEKMASLGELTAGIAHEIQNPLNFVNNFSEVNKELIEEVKSQKSKLKSKELDELLDDIALNEEKINHHGKRADAIVKGMLQHSRSSSGQKEPTDINALCDEYLRLAYHGLRAKDKSFNATIKTYFDNSIGKIDIIPQDIGRVILNLSTNAFYAVDEKKKQTGETYEPIVSVTTKSVSPPSGVRRAEIRVTDNGNGIPQNITDKIFQPFFTTKPTGQGTGLGLSLAYDIVKAHGGELKVETKENTGTTFTIQLPSV